jgi:hypothetical protein
VALFTLKKNVGFNMCLHRCVRNVGIEELAVCDVGTEILNLVKLIKFAL